MEKLGQLASEEAGGVEGLSSGPGRGRCVLPGGLAVLLLREQKGDVHEAEADDADDHR